MEALISISGVVGAMCCVGMYAAVSFGHISAEKPLFFMVNALGAGLVLVGASHQFDIGDLGTIGQELIWAVISLIGAARAWQRERMVLQK
jgi:FtsH-binding integral membrane protein